MAVIDNTMTTADTEFSLDIDMLNNFNQDYSRLSELLGIVSPEIVAAGTALYQAKITGELNDETYTEGDEVPLSEYKIEKIAVGDLTPKPYRRLVTAAAVLKSGYDVACARVDAKMLNQVRSSIIADFFGFLANGTGEASGSTLQEALAMADATLSATLETNGDQGGRIVHFVNTMDIGSYLGNANITVQTVFGMTYLQNFLGITDVFATVNVPEGTVYAVPSDNLHMYGIDFGALGQSGLAYTTYDGSLIGVAHVPAYNRVSAETDVLSGALLFAEILDYIVIGTFSGASPTKLSATATASAKKSEKSE